MSKRWPFTLASFILLFLGLTLANFAPNYSVFKYVGWGIYMLGIGINLFPQRPRKRRWLALGTFFVLAEIGVFLPAFWQNGLTLFISILFIIAGGLAAIFIPPRMPLWTKKETPEAQA